MGSGDSPLWTPQVGRPPQDLDMWLVRITPHLEASHLGLGHEKPQILGTFWITIVATTYSIKSWDDFSKQGSINLEISNPCIWPDVVSKNHPELHFHVAPQIGNVVGLVPPRETSPCGVLMMMMMMMMMMMISWPS